MRFTFCTKSCWPGVKTALNGLRKVVKETYPEAENVMFDVPEGGMSSQVFRELKSYPPKILFVGCWDVSIRNIVQNVDKSKTKVFLLWCSPITQIELGGEIPQFVDVINFIKLGYIDYVSTLLENDANVLKHIKDNFCYTPVYMDFEELNEHKIRRVSNIELECDLFCAPNHRKNILMQLLVLSQFDKLKIRTNYSSPFYQEISKRLLSRNSCLNHNWMTRGEYLKTIQMVDFSTQVSLSEGFNLTAAEHMYYGVPVICSNAIPFVKNKKEISDLVVNDQTDAVEITECVRRMIDGGPEYRKEKGFAFKKIVEAENKKNKEIIINLLEKIIER